MKNDENNNVTEETTTSDDQINAALAEVKKAKGRGRPKLSEEERARRDAAALAEKEARKAAREALRAERNANKPEAIPGRLKKLEKAAQRLPALTDEQRHTVDTLFQTFNRDEISGLIAHVDHELRVHSVTEAQNVELEMNALVRINNVASRFHGKLGRVTKVGKLRCYVAPLDAPEREEYLFLSDVTKVGADEHEELPAVLQTVEETLDAVG